MIQKHTATLALTMLLLTASPVLVNPKPKLRARIPDGRIVRWE